MIRVIVGNNAGRTPVLVDADTTLRKVLDDNNVDYSDGAVHLDGATLQPGDLDKTFADFNIRANCFLMKIKKLDNAA